MTFGAIAVGVGLVVGAGASIYATSTQAGIADRQLNLAQDQQGKQDTAFNQLQELMNNPASFFSSPVYQAAFGQGTQAIARQSAAGGLNNTSSNVPQGGEATELQAYGQSFGQQQLFNQEQLLASMSGTGANPAGALQGASGASSAAAGGLNALAGLLSFFGTSGMGGNQPPGNGAWNSPAGAPINFDGSVSSSTVYG
jgi:hypothetical protein